MNRLSKNNLGIVVVCYDTGIDFLSRLSKYVAISNSVIVVINKFSSAGQQRELVESIRAAFRDNLRNGSLAIEELSENFGIALAMNHGIVQLSSMCEWFLFFDDDTVLEYTDIDQIDEELEQAIKYSGDRKLGILALGYRSGESTVNDEKVTNLKDRYADKYAVISSGSIIALEIFREFGLFEERYFIDSVDVEYALRLKSHGCAIIQSKKPSMFHPIGRRYEVSLLGKKMLFSEHNSVRCYYIGRNRVSVGLNYIKQFPEVFVYSQIQTMIHLIRIIAFEKNKFVKVVRMLRGFAHGLMGKSGKLIPGGSK